MIAHPPWPDDQHCELSEERVELTANSNELIFTRVLIVLPSSNAFRTPRRGWSAVWIFGINNQQNLPSSITTENTNKAVMKTS